MSDPRQAAYAKLLVERCINVQPGWQVILQSTPLARPLLEEVMRAIAERGAHVLLRLNYPSLTNAWARNAPEELLSQFPSIDAYTIKHCDALISIQAPENTRDGTDLPTTRQALLSKASRPAMQRLLDLEVPWVASLFPTPALAQDAGMSLRAFEDLVYGACLLDWDEEERKMNRIKSRFDQTSLVRLVGDGTDLSFSIQNRDGMVDGGHRNLPGGEVFYCPIEDSAEGVISFSECPAFYLGREVSGIRLVFRQGRVIEASAHSGEEFLLKILDTDNGARALGEFGIGCNPGIQTYNRNVLFDEKIYGTIHLAIGASYTFLGGTNVSAIHWDIVKDLRSGGQIYCDGGLVQKDGVWQF